MQSSNTKMAGAVARIKNRVQGWQDLWAKVGDHAEGDNVTEDPGDHGNDYKGSLGKSGGGGSSGHADDADENGADATDEDG